MRQQEPGRTRCEVVTLLDRRNNSWIVDRVGKVGHGANLEPIDMFSDYLDVAFAPPFSIGNKVDPRPFLHRDRRGNRGIEVFFCNFGAQRAITAIEDHLAQPLRARKTAHYVGREQF